MTQPEANCESHGERPVALLPPPPSHYVKIIQAEGTWSCDTADEKLSKFIEIQHQHIRSQILAWDIQSQEDPESRFQSNAQDSELIDMLVNS
jgi:hypothetical protein